MPERQKLKFSIRNKSQRSARLGNKVIGKGDMRRGHPEMDNLEILSERGVLYKFAPSL